MNHKYNKTTFESLEPSSNPKENREGEAEITQRSKHNMKTDQRQRRGK
jgi:hypothetical protein